MADFPQGYIIIPGQPNAAVNPETGEILWRSGSGEISLSPQTQQGVPASAEQMASWGITPGAYLTPPAPTSPTPTEIPTFQPPTFEIPQVYPKSESWSGLPGWGQEWVKGWMSSISPQVTTGLQEALAGIKSAPSIIEQSRTLIPEQYRSQMGLYTQEALRPVLSNLAARGVLSSSVAEGALANVLREQQAKYEDLVRQANVWAAEQQLNQLYKALEGYQRQQNLLASLLGLTRESTGMSEDQWAPYATLLSLMF